MHWLKLFKVIIFSFFIFFTHPLLAGLNENSTNNSSTNDFPVPQISFAPRHYICYQTDIPIQIDGKIIEPIWEKSDWTDAFVDIEGEVKPAPRFQTRAKMLWDNQYLYFAAELEEPDVWATLTQRDTVIFYDNDFEIFIDPNGDTHEYYEFEMNAFSTEWDLFLVKPYRDGGPAMNSWDIQGLKTAVFVNGTINHPGDKDSGWTLEVAMPWSVLKECAYKQTPPLSGDQWRINFSRVEWQVQVKNGNYQKIINPKTGKPFPEDNWVWSPQGIINMHYPEMWGFVQFSSAIAGTSKDKFVMYPEEYSKWILRDIYYKQKNYFIKHHRYTDNVTELTGNMTKLPGYTFPPKIRITWNQFEACLENLETKERWYINQEGKTWRQLFQKK